IKNKVVFIAGGIGITPFYKMLMCIVNQKKSNQITLIWSNKTAQDIVYQKNLESLRQNNPDISIIHTLTQEKWNGEIGRIDEQKLKKHHALDSSYIYYICGPEKMKKNMIGILKKNHVPIKNIQFEKFNL
ncbi:MAG: FAD-dependent oxidoreductase, partial [Spirochaetes bacterium]|nr:FAD-dependent oxidoreductase [Spirochaetota bacterium]